MKRILLLLILAVMFICNGCFTPKMVETVDAPPYILKYPKYPLPIGYDTYALKIVNRTDDFKSPNAFEKNKYLRLYGFEETTQDSADIIVSFKMLNSSKNVDIKSKKHTNEDDNGNEYEYKRYYYQLEQNIKTDLVLKNNEGKIIKNPDYLGKDGQKKYYNSKEYKTRSKAKNAWKEDKDDVMEQIKEDLRENILEKTRKQLVNHYSYNKKMLNFPAYSFESDEYNYSDLQKAANIYKKATKTYSEKGKNEEVDEQLDKSIKIWKEAADEYKSKKNKSRLSEKNIGYVYFNLALAHFCKHEFDEASKYIEKAKNEKRNKMLENSLENDIRKFAENHKEFKEYKKERKAKRQEELKEIRNQIKGNWQVYKIDLGRKVDLNGDNVKSANIYHEYSESLKPIKLFMKEDFKGAMKMGEEFIVDDTTQFNWSVKRDTINFNEDVGYSKKQKYNVVNEEVIFIHVDTDELFYTKWPVEIIEEEKLVIILPTKEGIVKMYMKQI